MKIQIQAILICMLMLISTLVIVPRNIDVEAASYQYPNCQVDKIDYPYVHEITEYLSKIVNTSYVNDTLKKGRAFGTKGEHAAADYLETQMDDLNLESVEKDPIGGENTKYNFTIPRIQDILEDNDKDPLLTKIEINSSDLTIHLGQQHFALDNSEFYITPRWGFYQEIDELSDLEELTHVYQYSGVKIHRANPILLAISDCFLRHEDEILNQFLQGSLNETDELYEYFESLFEEDYQFSFDDFDPNNEDTYPSFGSAIDPPLGSTPDPFVFIHVDPYNNPNFRLNNFFGNRYGFVAFTWKFIYMFTLQRCGHCFFGEDFLGTLMYDMPTYNSGVHNMPALDYIPLPIITVNGEWEQIYECPSLYTLDFTLDQSFITDTTSYNVYGEIEGDDPTKTILIDCLYDSWFDQGTADAAIGMGIVLGIAKVMKYLESMNITPKYNVKFVAFGGEEAGLRGAYDYDTIFKDEDIKYVIDLNQLGFSERYEHLTFNIFTYDPIFSRKIASLANETNFEQRVNGVSDFKVDYRIDGNPPSDHVPFIYNFSRRVFDGLKAMCFLEDTGWTLHHRTGQQYDDGDSMLYYDYGKVAVTGEMIWNITKYLAYDHKSSFNDTAPKTFYSENIDGDEYQDSITAAFTVSTEFPHDRVTVRAKLFDNDNECKMITRKTFDIDYFNKQCTMTITLPPTATAGFYKLVLELLNDTERIDDDLHTELGPLSPWGIADDTITSGLSYFYLHPRSNTRPEAPTFYVDGNPDTINILESRDYIVNSIDADNDPVAYLIDWDTIGGNQFIDTCASGEDCIIPHTYVTGGEKNIKVKSLDSYENLFDWSPTWSKWGEFSEITNYNITVRWIPDLIETQSSLYSAQSIRVTQGQQTTIYCKLPLNYGPVNYTWTITTEMKGLPYTYYTNTITYNFEELGANTVNLTITDAQGTTSSIEIPVIVSNLTARFNTSNNHSLENNEKIFFNDTSTGVNTITNWTWDFGDNTTAYGRFVNHSYFFYGDYNVTLTITDNKTNTSVYHKIITATHDIEPPHITNTTYEVLQNDSQTKVLLTAIVTDPGRGVNTTMINITNPTGEQHNYTMNYFIDDLYYLNFTNITTSGEYTYTIWTNDHAGNNNSTVQTFTISPIFGYTLQGNRSYSIHNLITGSNFTIPEYGRADSISAYIQPGQDSQVQAMIYRENDSTLIGATEEITANTTTNPSWFTLDFNDPKPILQENTDYVLSIWSDETCTLNYTTTTNNNGRYVSATYDGTPPEQPTFTNENRLYSIYCQYTPDAPPEINNVIAAPDDVGCGLNTTISADIIDPISGINLVNASITQPDNSTENYTMTPPEPNTNTYTLVFNDTNQLGQYNYTIWATDNSGKTNSSTEYNFIVHTKPYTSFDTPPTPINNTNQSQTWTQVNVTVQDELSTSAFIDWNKSLRGYWPMDAYNTTGVYDNSTFQNFGTFHDGISTTNITNGRYGKGLEYDGTNDYVDLGNNMSLNLGEGDFTFMVWEKSDQTTYTNKAIILTNKPTDAKNKGYIFGVLNHSYLYVTQTTGNNVTLNGNTDVTDTTWHHIAYVRKETNYSIYVDGIYDTSVNGGVKNITNNQHTYLSNGAMTDSAFFDGMLDEPQLYNRALSREEINASYNSDLHKLYQNFTGLTDGHYEVYAHAINTLGNQSTTETRHVTIDTKEPSITDVSGTPDLVGFGGDVTITADVNDSCSGVYAALVNITYPNHLYQNYTMDSIGGNTYRYVFYDTWIIGQYNWTIWTVDHAGNTNSSTGQHFNLSANATIEIQTLKNNYGPDEYINITDPPEDGGENDGDADNFWTPYTAPGMIGEGYQINYTRAWQYILNRINYTLEAKTTGEYHPIPGLTIAYRDLADDQRKFSVLFNATEGPDGGLAYYQVNLSIDKNLVNYSINLSARTITLTYLAFDHPYNLSLNYSDVAGIPGLTLSHGIANGRLWVSITGRISKGLMVVWDPSYTVSPAGITSATFSASGRKIVCDDNGILYCVYLKSNTKNDVYLAHSHDSGVTWTLQRLTMYTNYHAGFPAIAIDANNLVHIAYSNHTSDAPVNYKLTYRTYNHTSNVTSSEVTIGDALHNAITEPCIAIDSNNNVHVAWDQIRVPSKYDIRYQKKTGSTWGSVMNISAEGATLGKHQLLPNVVVDYHDNVSIYWYGMYGALTKYQIRTKKYWDANSTWSTTINITSSSYDQISPSACVNKSGKVFLVWQGKDASTYYRINFCNSTNGLNWGTVSTIASGYVQERPTVSSDNHSVVHVVWSGYLGSSYTSDPLIRYKNTSDGGGTWSSIVNLTGEGSGNYHPNLMWSVFPLVSGIRPDIPVRGYAFVWTNYTTVCFMKSSDVIFDMPGIPNVSSPYPVNGSMGVPLQPQCSIFVYQSVGRSLTVTWQENSTGSWVTRQVNSSVASSSTVRFRDIYANVNVRWYWWRIYVDDGTTNMSWCYCFKTIDGPPLISNPQPTPGSTVVCLSPDTNITVNDPRGEKMTVKWLTSYSTPFIFRPDGDVMTQLDSSGAHHYTEIDDATLDAGDYVYTDSTSSYVGDRYSLQNHTSQTFGIQNVTITAYFYDPDGCDSAPCNAGSAKLSFYIGSAYFNKTVYDSASPVNGYYQYGLSVNPSTGLPWTWDDIDDLQVAVWMKWTGWSDNCYCYQLFVEVNPSSISGLYEYGQNFTSTPPYNGTYRQNGSIFDVNSTMYWWKVVVNDSSFANTSDLFSFFIGRQSKIKNIGSMDISGYLSMQVQYYNTTLSSWVVADDIINETTTRTILVGQQLGLDTIFNGYVNTSDLLDEFGSGTYRVYAAFRDPYGNALICSDATKLEATWEFTITTS